MKLQHWELIVEGYDLAGNRKRVRIKAIDVNRTGLTCITVEDKELQLDMTKEADIV